MTKHDHLCPPGLKAARAAVDAAGARKDTAWDMRVCALLALDKLMEEK